MLYIHKLIFYLLSLPPDIKTTGMYSNEKTPAGAFTCGIFSDYRYGRTIFTYFFIN